MADTTADTITIDIVARLEGLEAGLREAEDRINRTTANFGRAADQAARFGLSMARIVGTARLLESSLRAVSVAVGLMSSNMETFVSSMEKARAIPLFGQGVQLGEAFGGAATSLGIGGSLAMGGPLGWLLGKIQANSIDTTAFQIGKQAELQSRAFEHTIGLSAEKDEGKRIGMQADYARQQFNTQMQMMLHAMNEAGIPLSHPVRKGVQMMDLLGQIEPYISAVGKLEAARGPATVTSQTALGQARVAGFGTDSSAMVTSLKEIVRQILESNKHLSESTLLLRRLEGQGFF